MSTTQVSDWYGVSLPGKEAMFACTVAEKVKFRTTCNRFFKELHPKQHARYFPERIVLNIDDTDDTVQGGQQLALFNAHFDAYCF